jgi:hypothetical protein
VKGFQFVWSVLSSFATQAISKVIDEWLPSNAPDCVSNSWSGVLISFWHHWRYALHPYQKAASSPLWNPEVSRIKDSRNRLVSEFGRLPLSLLKLEGFKEFRHILDYECKRVQPPDYSKEMLPQLVHPRMPIRGRHLSEWRKPLARRATYYEMNVLGEVGLD